ncbi:MAG: hypothetical protein V4611_03290 [Patescibacteria group bacterium]
MSAPLITLKTRYGWLKEEHGRLLEASSNAHDKLLEESVADTPTYHHRLTVAAGLSAQLLHVKKELEILESKGMGLQLEHSYDLGDLLIGLASGLLMLTMLIPLGVMMVCIKLTDMRNKNRSHFNNGVMFWIICAALVILVVPTILSAISS